MHSTIFWRGSGEVEELCTLVYRESTDTLVHIPEKWNRSLDHMGPTHLSANDGEFTRIEERVELMCREEIEDMNVGVFES